MTMAVALASASITGLAMSSTAQAATNSNVKIRICNFANGDMQCSINGKNQNGDQVTYTLAGTIAKGRCHTSNWWWAVDQKFKVSFSVAPYADWREVIFQILNNPPDGSTFELSLDETSGN
ncbi:hypothetical protein [Streptomyces sp. NBC_01314]|uniref:hypothetical protein n=1 Tax=Streptomyces sp. NBC_01314 TaxID=2903821 RepID=UPI00308A29D4|nr:hypothetical protein OG622_49105 [Streptomyces sp. NBC_01314]